MEKMCRPEKEIIENDIICQEHLDFIDQKKAEIQSGGNGYKDYEILQARTAIKNRVLAIQTKENVDAGFESAKTAREQNAEAAQAIADDLESHLNKDEKNPSLIAAVKKAPIKTISYITSIFLFYFTLLHTILFFLGLEGYLTKIFTGVISP